MNKRKKILILLLCAAMVLSLAACGGKNGTGGNSGTGSGGNPAPTPTAGGSGSGSTPVQDTYVYVPEYVPISSELDGYPSSLLYADGRFLTSVYGVIRSEIPEGVTPEWEGQYDIYGNKFYWLNLDGSMEALSAYEPMPAPTFEEGVDGSGSSYVNQYTLTPTGDLAVIEEVYSYWYEGPAEPERYSDAWYEAGYYIYERSEENFYLRLLNADGGEKACIPLNDLQQDEESYFYIGRFAADASGYFYLTSDMTLYILDSEGTLVKTLTTENWFDSLVNLPDGRVAASQWDMNGYVLLPIDPVTLELDTENPIPLGNGMYDFYGMSPSANGEYDFLFTNGSNLMGYKLSDGSTAKILNWINSDVDPNELSNTAFMLPDGRIVALETQWNDDSMTTSSSFVFLKQVPASSLEQKQIITLATLYLDYQTRSRIVKFNRSSPDFRIELRDYSEYNTEEDYEAGLTKLTAELMAGNMPDILSLDGMPVGQLESRGMLTDLYPLLNADSELNGQLIEGVLQALDSNGKLYRTAPSFQLFTVMGGASVVGDTPGWTLKDFETALSNMPEGCEPFNSYMTRGTILNFMLNMNWDQLVNWDTGKCSFDTGLFADILKFAARFPETYEYDEDYVWTEEDDEMNRIASGKQMLMYTWLYDFRDWQYYNAMFGGDATCIGFPVSEGVGNAFQFDGSGYAITTGCKHPEAAWQYIRSTLTADYQEKNVWTFPTNKVAFQKRLEEAMTPRYQTDADGNFILDENGEKIEEFDYWGWSGGSVEIGAVTQAEADKILAVIDSTTRVTEYDDELYSIILTDCEAFFAGQKSAEEVSKLLQSKMTIYVNEQR